MKIKKAQKISAIVMLTILFIQSVVSPITALAETDIFTEKSQLILDKLTIANSDTDQVELSLETELENPTEEEQLFTLTTSSPVQLKNEPLPEGVTAEIKNNKVEIKASATIATKVAFTFVVPANHTSEDQVFAVTENNQRQEVVLPKVEQPESSTTSEEATEEEADPEPDSESATEVSTTELSTESVESTVESSTEVPSESSVVSESETSTDEVVTTSTEESTETTVAESATKSTSEATKLSETETTESTEKKAVEKKQKTQKVAPSAAIQENIITGIKITDIYGNPSTPEKPIDPYGSDGVLVSIEWELPDNHDIKAGDTFSFELPDIFKGLAGTDGRLDDFGSYTIDENGLVTMTFNENVGSDKVHGKIDLYTWLDALKLEKETQQRIEIPLPGGKIEVDLNLKPKGGALIAKEGTIDKGFKGTFATWTVDVNTGLNKLVNPTISDNIPAGLTFDKDSVEITVLDVDIDGNVTETTKKLAPEDYDVVVDSDGNPQIKLNVTGDDQFKAYRVKYKTTVDNPDELEELQTWTNEAKMTNDGKESDSVKSTVSSNYGQEIKKDHPNYNPKEQTFDWELEYNLGNKKITADHAVIQDKWNPTGVMDLEDLDVYPVTVDESGKVVKPITSTPMDPSEYELVATDAGFTLKFKNGVEQPYVVKYKTKVKQNGGIITEGGDIANKVTTDSSKTDGSNGTFQQQGVIKESTDYDVTNKTISWKIAINGNHYQMDNLELSDTFSADGLSLLPDTLKLVDQDGRTLTRGTDYELTWTDPTPGHPGGFNIKLIGAYKSTKKSFTLTYDTHFERNSDGSGTYRNSARIDWKEGDTEHSSKTDEVDGKPEDYTGPNGVKSGRYNPVSKEITWTINANYARLDITGKEFSISDDFDASQEYVDDSLIVYEYSIDKQGKITRGAPIPSSDYTVTLTDGKLVVDFKEEAKKKGTLGIEFRTKFKNDVINKEKIENTAEVKSGSTTIPLKAEATAINEGNNFANKTGSQDGNKVNWSITMNPNGSLISDYELTDTVADPENNLMGSVLIEDSFRLYEATIDENGKVVRGNEMTAKQGEDYTLDIVTTPEGKQQFTIKFKNDIHQPYILEYKTLVDEVGKVDIKNRYEVKGNNTELHTVNKEVTVEVQISGSEGSAQGTRGTLKIIKMDEHGNQLTGPDVTNTVFELWSLDGTVKLRTGKLNDKGELSFPNLRGGKYRLVEKSAPNGFVVSDELADTHDGTVIDVPIDANDTWAEIKVENSKPKVTLRKLGENGAKITSDDPAEFTIYDAETNQPVHFSDVVPPISDGKVIITNGEVTVELPVGKYYAVETKAPGGYIQNRKQRVDFEVKLEDNGTQKIPKVAITNYQGAVKWQKVNQDGKNVAGAEFVVKDSTGKEIKTGRSNANGEVLIQGLAPGTYTLEEKRAPNDYIKNPTVSKPFTIADNHTEDQPAIVELTDPALVNYRQKVQMQKLDAKTNTGLAGAEFAVRKKGTGTPQYYVRENPDGTITWGPRNQAQRFLSNATGLVEGPALGSGTYEFEEIKAVKDYVRNSALVEFTIQDETDAALPTLDAGSMNNYKGSVELAKKDSNQVVALTGVVFQLLDAQKNVIQDGLTTDHEGKIKIEDLAPGTYFFKEVETLPGYILNTELLPFTIPASAKDNASSIHRKVQMLNYHGTVRLTKQVENGQIGPSQTAEFRFRKKGTNDYLIRSEEGHVLFETVNGDIFDSTVSPTTIFQTVGNVIEIKGLEPGEYEFVEIKAPKDHIRNATPIPVEITNEFLDQPIVNVSLDNYQGRAELLKVNGQGDYINLVNSGVEFKVYEKNDPLKLSRGVIQYTPSGQVHVSQLAPGEYTIEEIKAPADHIENPTTFDFVIPTDASDRPVIIDGAKNGIGSKERMILNDYQGSAELTKTAGETLVDGAEFKVVDSQGNTVKDGLKSVDGKVRIDELAPGNYAFVETKPAPGYQLNTTPKPFTIQRSAHGQPDVESAGTLDNQRTLVSFTKYGENKQGLPQDKLQGITFAVKNEAGEYYNGSGSGIVQENDWSATEKTILTSNADGLVTLQGLKPGKYTIEELHAPEHFKHATGDKLFFTIDALGKVTYFDKDNHAMKGEVINERTTTEFVVSKQWDDANNAFGTRPKEITITLYREVNGQKEKVPGITNPVTVTPENRNDAIWSHTFKDLLKFDQNGNEYHYSVEEEAIAGYTVSQDETVAATTLTNKLTKIDIHGQKTWIDNEQATGPSRPASITVQLYRDGKPAKDADGKEITATATAPDWRYSFGKLPEYSEADATKRFVYTVKEVPVIGYDRVENGLDVTNTLQTTNIQGKKVWKNDEAVKESTRPASITIELVRNGQVVATTQAMAPDYTYAFTDLPVADGEKTYEYTVQEVAVPGYTRVQNEEGTTFTNELNTTEVPIEKIWKDTQNPESRPDALTVVLDRYIGDTLDEQAVASYELTATDKWQHVFKELPTHSKNGEAYTYKVREVVGDNWWYEPNYLDDTTIENTLLTPGELQIIKTWDDATDSSVRPSEITIELYRYVDDEIPTKPYKTQVLTKKDALNDSQWQFKFTNLAPKDKNGKVYNYLVKEKRVNGYEEPIITNDGPTKQITNKLQTVDVPVEKIWQDKGNSAVRPSEITYELTRHIVKDGEKIVDSDFKETQQVDGNNWHYVFEGLAKTDTEGHAYVYTVKEKGLENYQPTIENQDGKTVITNTLVTKDVEAKKVWKDNNNRFNTRPETITLHLLQILPNGGTKPVVQNEKEVVATIRAKNGEWSHIFKDLPKVDENGAEINYTISEEPLANYDTTVEGMTVTNTLDTTSLKGQKIWENDAEYNGFSVRPDSITVQLWQNGQPMMSNDGPVEVAVQADENGDWIYEFKDLPKVDANGDTYEYQVVEEKLPDYEVPKIAEDNQTITNTLTTTRIAGEKIWDDNNDQDGKRPKEIMVRLYSDVTNKEIASQRVTADTNWHYEFANLPKTKDGIMITYHVSEDVIADYQTIYDGKDIVNSHSPGKTSLGVIKHWDDNNDQDGIRPAFITVKLLANGKDTNTRLTLSEANNWQATFQDLDEYQNGKKVVYTIEEVTVKGYDVQIAGDAEKGFMLTNVHEPAMTEVKGQKIWEDANNQDGKRPEAITVTLLANGEVIVTKEVTAADNWAYVFKELPEYANGEKITYTIREERVDNYVPSYDSFGGFDVTNTHAPGKTSVNVLKVWNDANDQDGLRPLAIDVELVANGKATGKEVTLNTGNNWQGGFTDLDEYQAGKKIEYTVKEADLPGYDGKLTGNLEDGFILTNTHKPEMVEMKGQKVWKDENNQDGVRPNEIIVHLLADGIKVDSLRVTGDNQATEWAYEFKDLPKFADGHEIVYTVQEDGIDEYSDEVMLETITNTRTPEKTSVNVTKGWKDANDQDGIRPKFITMQLFANGEDTKQRLHLSEANNWQGEFTNLDVFKPGEIGQRIRYTVKEVAVEGYETVITGNAQDGFNVVNHHEPAMTTIKGIKTWKDANNQDGKRPDEIVVRLFANGSEIRAMKVTAADDWRYEFTDLPKFDNGEFITYTIQEDKVAGYSTKIDGHDITNSYTPGKTSVNVMKAWDDVDDQDGIRPISVKVKLLADGKETGKEALLSAGTNWQANFTELDEFKAGKRIVYTIKEEAITGYEESIKGSAENGFKITNRHTPELIDLSGEKTWDDVDNQDGKRPEAITVYLIANGKRVATKVVTAADDWKYTFENLPKSADGAPIHYTIQELRLDDYSTTFDQMAITNQRTPEKTSIQVIKNWNDGNDQDGLRPDDIDVTLFANGKKIQVIKLKAKDNWQGSFTDLDVYEQGKRIVYTIEEEKVRGYDVSITGNEEIGYIIHNHHEPEQVAIEGEKIWEDANNQDGKRPEAIMVRLYGNDKRAPIAFTKVTGPDWHYAFTNLPKKENGITINYRVQEDHIADYTTTYDGFNITNRHTPGKTSVNVMKAWEDAGNQDGKRPDFITVKLLADGKETGQTLVLSEANGWQASFTKLKEYRFGKKIVYTVEEVATEGYEATITGNAADGFVITNHHDVAMTEIKGKKIWEDADNQDGKRPDSITIRLLANGEVIATKEVTAADKWAYHFKELPQFADGQKINYTLQEDKVADYSTVIDGFDITNRHTPGKTSIQVTKAWEDENDQDGLRPRGIYVELLANGQPTGQEIVLNEGNNWHNGFTDLDEFANGQPIDYTVKEADVDGYTSELTGSAENGFVLINHHETEMTEIQGQKTWKDANNQDGKRPDSIVVRLLANGVEVDYQRVTAADNWHYHFTNLPKYMDGEEIDYVVQEDGIPSYSTTIMNPHIINTHTPNKTSIHVTKAWHDEDDQDGLRPGYITVKLLANGKDTGKQVLLSESTNWQGHFTDLDEYQNGQLIQYTVEEVAVAGYQSLITGSARDGFTIINYHTPEMTSIQGEKTWKDADNQDGKRPEFITVRLFADGVEVRKMNVTGPNWHYEFTDLPKFENGRAVHYAIQEDKVTNYSTTIEGYDITNTYTPSKTTLHVTKAWDDAENQDGIRPNAVTVQLLADGKETGKFINLSAGTNWQGVFADLAEYKDGKRSIHFVKVWNDDHNQDGLRSDEITVKLFADGVDTGKEMTVNALDNWQGSFDDLPESKDGKFIHYTVKEVTVEGYETEITGDESVGFIIHNHHESETVEITGEKVWYDDNNHAGKRPKSIMIRLYGEDKTNPVAFKKVTAADNWHYAFNDLPKFADGKEIYYTVREDSVEDYQAGYDDETHTIFNTLSPGERSIPVTKVWEDQDDQDGIRPENITVKLLANGKETGKEKILNRTNDWEDIFIDLPKNDETGKEIVYSVEEIPVAGYESHVHGDASGFVITNTHQPDTTSIKGTKTWQDNQDQAGKRPDEITVRLFAGEQEVATKQVTEKDAWTYEFTDLPKFAAGEEISYHVQEDVVEGYTTTIDGFNITNSYTPNKTSINVVKHWKDFANLDGIRPDKITVNLLANGKATGKTLTLTEKENWQGAFKNLDEYQDGKKIVYTIEEDAVEGYKEMVVGNAKRGFIVINTHKPTLPVPPTPNKPDKPGRPNRPHIPNKPNYPSIPNRPNRPSRPQVPERPRYKGKLPRTGEMQSWILPLIGFILISGVIVFVAKRRKK